MNGNTNHNHVHNTIHGHNHNDNHVLRPKLTVGQRVADRVAKIGGSWSFILGLAVFLFIWITLNMWGIFFLKWDPYPFILLNLFLSCLATFQAPIILMAQNRSAERDRSKAERDYAINRKAEREVVDMQKDLEQIKHLLHEHLIKK